MLSVAEARSRILSAVEPLPAESLYLGEATDRILAEALTSRRHLPPADNSALDGYGVRREDVVGAREDAPVTLEVIGAVQAGDTPALPTLAAGQAVRIMTGGVVPAGVDAVVMRERTDESEVKNDDGTGTVRVFEAPPPANAIRRRGEDIAAGDEVATPGMPLTPARVNLVASAGHVVVQVHRRPVVAILASGDELRELGTATREDEIINSNAHAVAAAARAAGAVPQLMGIAADTLEDHVRRVRASAFADVLVTIGGVSMGTHDFVRPALEEVGATLDFWKVAMRPGKPLAFGRHGRQLVFGLPGNPVSSQVGFELWVRPTIRRMMGQRDVVRRLVRARVLEGPGAPFKKKPDVTFFARAHLRLQADGAGFEVELRGKQGSGQVSGLATANALVALPEGTTGADAGDIVDVMMLDASPFFQNDSAAD